MSSRILTSRTPTYSCRVNLNNSETYNHRKCYNIAYRWDYLKAAMRYGAAPGKRQLFGNQLDNKLVDKWRCYLSEMQQRRVCTLQQTKTGKKLWRVGKVESKLSRDQFSSQGAKANRYLICWKWDKLLCEKTSHKSERKNPLPLLREFFRKPWSATFDLTQKKFPIYCPMQWPENAILLFTLYLFNLQLSSMFFRISNERIHCTMDQTVTLTVEDLLANSTITFQEILSNWAFVAVQGANLWTIIYGKFH